MDSVRVLKRNGFAVRRGRIPVRPGGLDIFVCRSRDYLIGFGLFLQLQDSKPFYRLLHSGRFGVDGVTGQLDSVFCTTDVMDHQTGRVL